MNFLDIIALLIATVLPAGIIAFKNKLNLGPFSGVLMAEGNFLPIASQAQELQKKALTFAKNRSFVGSDSLFSGLLIAGCLGLAGFIASSPVLAACLWLAALPAVIISILRPKNTEYSHREDNFYSYMLGLVMVNLDEKERAPILAALTEKLLPSQAAALTKISPYLTAAERNNLLQAIDSGDKNRAEHVALRAQLRNPAENLHQEIDPKELLTKAEEMANVRTLIQRNPLQGQQEVEQLKAGFDDTLKLLAGQAHFFARPHDVYCPECLVFVPAKRIQAWRYFQCQYCESSENLVGNVDEVIGWLGNGPAPEVAEAQLIIPIWNAEQRKAIPANIDTLWLEMGMDKEADWPVNAALALCDRPKNRGKLQWKAIGEGELDLNTRRILDHSAGISQKQDERFWQELKERYG